MPDVIASKAKSLMIILNSNYLNWRENMSHVVVWVEHDHAKIFTYTSGAATKKDLKNKHTGSHHTGGHENEKKNNIQKFYHEIAEVLAGATEILLVGPGMAKTEFKAHLEHHNHAALAKLVIGIEAMDKSTDGEIQNMAKKFFQKYNLFHS